MACQSCARLERVEELLTDLITFVGRMNGKTLSGQEQLRSIQVLLLKAEAQLNERSLKIEERLLLLEKAHHKDQLSAERTLLAEETATYTAFSF
ncbi:hypothetical protein [Peribacillus kribbensis]|uniref:hypothetical protein n=1 Tax=Peribacillus kribbensis TaxID=356658 RepID=UPI00040ECF3F|nr:hypothetical protein [Peribacillus kribbensis]